MKNSNTSVTMVLSAKLVAKRYRDDPVSLRLDWTATIRPRLIVP